MTANVGVCPKGNANALARTDLDEQPVAAVFEGIGQKPGNSVCAGSNPREKGSRARKGEG